MLCFCSICPPRCCQIWVILYSKKSPLFEGKYSLGNRFIIPIDYEFMMKYLLQWIVTKISGFRMFSNTALFHSCQKPLTYPLYNLDKYCKISLSGGLAQLVEQRTLNPFVASSTLASPTTNISFFS